MEEASCLSEAEAQFKKKTSDFRSQLEELVMDESLDKSRAIGILRVFEEFSDCASTLVFHMTREIDRLDNSVRTSLLKSEINELGLRQRMQSQSIDHLENVNEQLTLLSHPV